MGNKIRIQDIQNSLKFVIRSKVIESDKEKCNGRKEREKWAWIWELWWGGEDSGNVVGRIKEMCQEEYVLMCIGMQEDQEEMQQGWSKYEKVEGRIEEIW